MSACVPLPAPPQRPRGGARRGRDRLELDRAARPPRRCVRSGARRGGRRRARRRALERDRRAPPRARRPRHRGRRRGGVLGASRSPRARTPSRTPAPRRSSSTRPRRPGRWTRTSSTVRSRHAGRRGARVRAVVAVDLYGQCCDYEALAEVCARHDVALVQDAAESLGATYRGRPAGGQGSARGLLLQREQDHHHERRRHARVAASATGSSTRASSRRRRASRWRTTSTSRSGSTTG